MKVINNTPIIAIAVIILFLSASINCLSHDIRHETKDMKQTVKFTTEINGIKEYRLSNGIKILLKQNDSIPLVTFSIWYKVGSRNEHNSIRGLAHFLEHMMFKGTKKFKKGEISETIQKYGGVFNAFTSSDGTAYYETISPKYLEKVIEIESDRMKSSALNEDELNLEKTVVLSELEGNLNNPVTLLDQELRKKAYIKSPYKHPTIGYEKDIRSINSQIMKDFYKQFYNPNNATIILVGNFNEKNALDLIEGYFGNIKNDLEKQLEEIEIDSKQKEEKKFTVSRAGSFKLVEIAYHIPDAKSEEIYPLNIIEEILIKGKKSRLNKALVEKGLATEVTGGAEANRDPGLFYILVSLTPKSTHKNIEKIITNEILKLIKDRPTEEEINAAKNRIRASYLFNLDGTYNQVLNLGFFELISTWKQSLDWPNKIKKVKPDEISLVLNKCFTKKNRTIGYFIPKIHKGEKYQSIPLNLSKSQHYSKVSKSGGPEVPKSGGLEVLTSRPQDPKTSLFKYTKTKLKDGSEILTYKNIDLPISYVMGVIKGGSSKIPKEKELACQLIARTLEKGSSNYSKEEIEDFLDSTGSQIEFSCDEESFRFNLISLNENLNTTVKLLVDLLSNPTFPKKEFQTEKEKLIAETIELKDSTGEISRRQFSQLIYHKDHPYYSNTFDEDINLIKKIDTSDLFEAHKSIVTKDRFIISIVTDLQNRELSSIISIIDKLSENKKVKEDDAINIPDTLIRENPKIESILVKDKTQSDVYLGHAGNLKRTDPDFYKLHIANYILGGSPLTSRLAKKIRDNSGLVYHIHSFVNATHGKGEFGIYFGANNANIDKAIELTRKELVDFIKDGITEEEFKKAKQALVDSFISRNLSTYSNISNTILGVEFYNLGENYINDYPKIISSLKLHEINETIKKYIFPDKLNIAIAGEYKKKKQG